MTDDRLGRQEISDAVGALGWRFVLGVVSTAVRVGSLPEAAALAAQVAQLAGPADSGLRIDLRPGLLLLTLQDAASAWPTRRELDLAARISAAVARGGRRTTAEVGSPRQRSVQLLEIAIDAMDIAAVRPFWKAALGYTAEAGADGPEDPLIDPLWQGPAVWFQQMDAPRPQRNRIHFDVSVPHDEAERRLEAALAAGGVLRSAARAPAFWVLADPEGNEVCLCAGSSGGTAPDEERPATA